MKFIPLLAILFIGIASPGVARSHQPNNHGSKLIVAYLPNWIDLKVALQNLDFAKITDIDLAFENPVDDAGTLSFNPDDDLVIKQSHAHRVKVFLSIGGGLASENANSVKRYFALQSDAKRASFVAILARYLKQHHFDGLDVDLEGAAIGKDYGSFVSDLSKALAPSGMLLTAAVSQGYGGDKIPNSVFKEFSFVNLMDYDATGPWNPQRPGQHSPIELAQANIDYWSNRGLSRAKMVLGVPFYGYGFGADFRNGDYPFSEIVSRHPGAQSLDQTGNTIYYNGLSTMKAKAKLAVTSGLAGVMIWSIDSDAVGKDSLLSALYPVVHP